MAAKSRSKLEHALKTRTTLASEFSEEMRGRNLALTTGANKQIRTGFLKQQFTVRDIEATRLRVIDKQNNLIKGLRHFSSEEDINELCKRFGTDALEKEIKTRKNTDLLLLEKRLKKQRELQGVNRRSFRTINVYKMDKNGHVVKNFDAMPVESLFPSLVYNVNFTEEVPSTARSNPRKMSTAEDEMTVSPPESAERQHQPLALSNSLVIGGGLKLQQEEQESLAELDDKMKCFYEGLDKDQRPTAFMTQF